MFKKYLAAFAVALALVVSFSGQASTVLAGDVTTSDVKKFKFATGDGKYDGQITSSRAFDVRIEVDAPKSYQMAARLCNADSGNCTQFKSLAPYDRTEFTQMQPGVYYGDIVSLSSEEKSGVVTYSGGFNSR